MELFHLTYLLLVPRRPYPLSVTGRASLPWGRASAGLWFQHAALLLQQLRSAVQHQRAVEARAVRRAPRAGL